MAPNRLAFLTGRCCWKKKAAARSSQGGTLFGASQKASLAHVCKKKMAPRARMKGQWRPSPDACERRWVQMLLHLRVIMVNTLEASPPQLLPLHKSLTSGPLISHCCMHAGGRETHTHTHAEKTQRKHRENTESIHSIVHQVTDVLIYHCSG